MNYTISSRKFTIIQVFYFSEKTYRDQALICFKEEEVRSKKTTEYSQRQVASTNRSQVQKQVSSLIHSLLLSPLL